MIVDERFITYTNSLGTGNSLFLEKIEKEARERHVPVIRRETQDFLRVLLALHHPERILEVGTGEGFSALFMAEYDPVSPQITTIENYGKRIPIAGSNFARAGRDGQITLLEGDAAEVLKTLEEPFDLIFMDAAKGQYIRFLEDALRLLVPGGVLLSDNVLQEGDILESKFAVTRRNRTIHKRMRAYLYELKHHPLLATTILPVGDGIALSVRLGEQQAAAGGKCRDRLKDCAAYECQE